MRLSGVILVCLLTAATQLFSAGDSLTALLNSYRESEEVARTLSEGERLAHYQEWLQRLLPAAEQSSDSPARYSAFTECVRLANSVGDFDLSKTLLSRLVAASESQPAEQARWLTEKGEVGKLQFRQTRRAEVRAEAIESFRKANSIFKLQSKGLRADTWEQFVLNSCWIGDLLRSAPANDDELREAADAFKEAREALSSHGPPMGRLHGTGYNVELTRFREAESAAQSGDAERAYMTLLPLSKLRDSQWPASFYVERVALKSYPAQGGDFRQFVRGWLDRAPTDDRSCVLLYLLAESYFREKRYDDALPLYLTLESEYAQSLLTIDGQLASEGRGGRYATVLQNLREIYLITGRRADAAAFNEKLMALFPQLGQHEAEVAKSVSKVHMDEVNLGKGELQAGKARSAWVIVIIVVNIIVLGMLIAVLLLRRYRRKG